MTSSEPIGAEREHDASEFEVHVRAETVVPTEAQHVSGPLAGLAVRSVAADGAGSTPKAAHTASVSTLRRVASTPPLISSTASPIIRRMTVGAATIAKTEKRIVWVQVKGRNQQGRVREIVAAEDTGAGQVIVDLLDGGDVTVSLEDVSDTPPPEVALEDIGSRRPLVPFVPGGSVSPGSALPEMTPDVIKYYKLLIDLDETARKRTVRELNLSLHPDKKGGDTALFQAFLEALELVKNGPVQVQSGEPLTVTHHPEGIEQPLPPSQPAVLGKSGPVMPALPQIGPPSPFVVGAALRIPPQLDVRALLVDRPRELAPGLRAERFTGPEVTRLRTLPQVHENADLARLDASGYPVPRLMALGGLAQATDLGALLQLAAIRQHEAVIVQLAGAAQAVRVADIEQLLGYVGVRRTAADVVQLARLGSASFAVPTIAEIGQLCSLPQTVAELVQFSRAPRVTNTADLITVAMSPHPLARLAALAGLALAIDLGTLLRLAAIALTEGEIVTLAGIPQAAQIADLEQLAGCVGPHGRTALDIVQLATLGSATFAAPTILEIGQLCALPCAIAEIVQFCAVPQVATTADLLIVATSGHPAARLSTLGALPLAANRVALLRIAAIVLPEADIVLLAGIGLVAGNIANLEQLAGFVGVPRTAADVVIISGLGSATFAAPTIVQVGQLCALPKTGAEIVQLSGAAKVINTATLIARVHATRAKEASGDTWQALDDRWEAIKRTWGARWPLTTLFPAVDATWLTASQLIRRITRDRDNPAPAVDLQTFALQSAQMEHNLDLIDQLGPAIDIGVATLATLNANLGPLITLQNLINNNMLLYYTAASPARVTTLAQQALVVNALATLNNELLGLNANQATYAGLAALTPAVVNQAILDQNAHQLTVNGVQTAALIDAPLAALRLGAFQDRLAYPNLRLTQVQTAHPFWQSLTPAAKLNFNTKLAGHPVTAWGVAGYPGTRPRQPSAIVGAGNYGGAQILIPTLNAFPVPVTGEIVHDWIFNSPGHGHPAARMAIMLNLAFARNPYSVLNLASTMHVQNNGRTVYSWNQTLINIIITAGGELLTYYNPSV